MNPNTNLKIFVSLLFVLVLLVAGCQGGAEDNSTSPINIEDNNGADYAPTIDPNNFVEVIDNPYLSFIPGNVWIYEGENEDGEIERVEVEVTSDTRIVMGVTTVVVRDRVWEDGELVEDTFDWFAQDKDGNVWYFGEDSKELEDGVVVNNEGVGNLYFNRKCTGALVDVQPFGGFNMSGTDSKAGGRDYLPLFMQAKSITERW